MHAARRKKEYTVQIQLNLIKEFYREVPASLDPRDRGSSKRELQLRSSIKHAGEPFQARFRASPILLGYEFFGKRGHLLRRDAEYFQEILARPPLFKFPR